MKNTELLEEFEVANKQWILENWDNEKCFGCNHIRPDQRYFDCANWKDCHWCDETFCSSWWSLENYLGKQIYICGNCKKKLLKKGEGKKK